MPVFQHDIDIPRLGEEALAKWRDIPAAVASDCLGRSQAMQGAIKPVDRSMRIVAQARTVEVMVAPLDPETGEGKSKQAAEREAATNLLAREGVHVR